MNIQPIPAYINFGVYKNTKKTSYGERVRGIINGYQVDVYTAYNEDKTKKHKLYYVSRAGQWVKSKLDFFKDNKKYKTVKSNAKNLSGVI